MADTGFEGVNKRTLTDLSSQRVSVYKAICHINDVSVGTGAQQSADDVLLAFVAANVCIENGHERHRMQPHPQRGERQQVKVLRHIGWFSAAPTQPRELSRHCCEGESPLSPSRTQKRLFLQYAVQYGW